MVMAIMFNATFNDISVISRRSVSLVDETGVSRKKNTDMMWHVASYYLNDSDLGLWWLTPLSTIFPVYRVGQFYLCVKPEYSEKTTNLSQITDKFR
jgi:hypothetical protein